MKQYLKIVTIHSSLKSKVKRNFLNLTSKQHPSQQPGCSPLLSISTIQEAEKLCYIKQKSSNWKGEKNITTGIQYSILT